jgi:hypothetical protein
MKIFISWSGDRSETLAKALYEWFPLVLHYVEPWLSKSDIQAGDRWSLEVAKSLESCNFGVLCITRENLNSPWILFEAGALAKSMEDGRVIPLLLDLDFKEISGPLAQFQAKKVESVGIKELVASLNKAATSPVVDAQLEKLFGALWDDLEKQISSIPKSTAPAKHNRPQGDILEELVSSVRNVELRVRDAMDDESSIRKRKRYRSHPGMMHEMMHHLMHRTADGPNDPIQLVFIASIVKDEAPWLYELALDAYRTLRSGSRQDGQKALRRFIDAFEMLQNGPFIEELGLDRMMMKMIRSDFFEMQRFFDFQKEQNVEGRPKRRSTVDVTKKD